MRQGKHKSSTNLAGKKIIGGATEASAHTINEDEKEEFINHINSVLCTDSDIGKRFPIDPKSMQLFDECKGGCHKSSDAIQRVFYCSIINIVLL